LGFNIGIKSLDSGSGFRVWIQGLDIGSKSAGGDERGIGYVECDAGFIKIHS